VVSWGSGNERGSELLPIIKGAKLCFVERVLRGDGLGTGRRFREKVLLFFPFAGGFRGVALEGSSFSVADEVLRINKAAEGWC